MAKQLTEFDALKTHARDELGIIDFTTPKPFQSAIISFLCFLTAGSIPLVATIIVSIFTEDTWVVIFVLWVVALVLLLTAGSVAAKIGNFNVIKGAFRVAFGGALALFLTMFVGYLSEYLIISLGYHSD